MKRFRLLLSLAVMPLFVAHAVAQNSGNIVYSLPRTTLVLEVEAVCESFHAGPYAKYAKQYLGVDVRQQDATSYKVSQVNVIPCIEADPSVRCELAAGNRPLGDNYLKVTSQGLISLFDSGMGTERKWRFPSMLSEEDVLADEATDNIASEDVELYRMVNKDGTYHKVAVVQSQTVAKSDQMKAYALAQQIFELRDKRMQIITGDTDATFSGSALKAAIDEITRLEKQYLTLFLGYSEYSVHKMSFDLTPLPDQEQYYVAFRVSDSAGLLPSDNISGRPVVASIDFETVEQDVQVLSPVKGAKADNVLYYRKPLIGTVKITDQSRLLIQTRVPFYQFGQTLTLPVAFLR